MAQNLIARGLRGIAVRLTSDPDIQNDLAQEMFVHFVHVRTAAPGRALAWCFQKCEDHARDYLRLGRKNMAVSLAENGPSIDMPHPAFPLVDKIELEGELITNDTLVVLVPLLSDMQQQVLYLLMAGSGVREAGRQLGITHPAVIKHRRKIARIARELLQETEGLGVAVAVHNGDASGNGEAHTA